jgi:hypothetical protein
MNIPKTCKLHLVAAKDLGRYTMNHIQHTPGKLWATNGRMAAVINVADDDGDTPGILIPADLVKLAVNKSGKADALVTANGSIKALGKDGLVEGKAGEGDFPKIEAIIPDVPKEHRVLIGLNAGMLEDLARAIGCENTTVCIELDLREFTKEKRDDCYKLPYRIDSPHGTGVLMPHNVEDPRD